MLTVSREQARNALARVNGFTDQSNGKKGVRNVLKRHPCIQSDPIDVAGRNHDLTLQSRVSDYKPGYLNDLLYRDRKFFEYYCKMLSVVPIDTYPIFHWQRQIHVARDRAFMKENRHIVNDIMAAAEHGPVASKDFSSEKMEHWWGKTKIARIVLENLWTEGRLAIHHREAGVKFYVSAEKIIPEKLLCSEPPSEAEAELAKVLMISKSSHLASATRTSQWTFAGRTSKAASASLETLTRSGDLFHLEIEGCKGNLYAPMEDQDIWADPPAVGESWTRFIAPLDPLLWNRALFREIYDHDYIWEVYKLPHDREYGYYCLPVLFNGDCVGLIEPFFRKKDRILEIRSFNLLKKELRKADLYESLENEIGRFARNLGAEGIEVGIGCPDAVARIAGRFA